MEQGKQTTRQADMPVAASVAAAGTWDEAREAGSLYLSYEERHRRRIVLRTDQGERFLLHLERPVLLRHGDGLALDAGGYVRIVAADEPVLDLRCDRGSDLLRLAWHIGNRHAPVMIVDEQVVRILADPVLEHMARNLGARVSSMEAPFHPEGGAYEGGHGHHDHSHHEHEGHSHG